MGLPGGGLPGGNLPGGMIGGGSLGGPVLGGGGLVDRGRPLKPWERRQAAETARKASRISLDDLPSYDDVDLGKIHGDKLFDPRYQQALKMRYAQILRRKFGLDYGSSMAASEVMWQRKMQHVSRAPTALKLIGKALSAPAEFASGFVAGGLGAKHDQSNVWDRIGHTFAQAGKEAVHNVGTTHKMAGDYLKDAGVLGNKYAGFAASTLFDPTMYLSFGATAPAKIMANRALHESASIAMVRANKIIAEKGGMYFGTKYNDPVVLMQAIRKADGMPMDLPQALDQLRGIGLQYKSSMRQLQPFDYLNPHTGVREVTNPSVGRVLGAYLLPTGVKGGRGVRFAGMQIPGTGTLTTGLARKMRSSVSTKLEHDAPLASGIMHGLATNPELRMAGEDTIRALALTEMAMYKASLQGAKLTAQETAREIAKGGGSKYIPPAEREGALSLERPILPHASALKRIVEDPGNMTYTPLVQKEGEFQHIGIGLDQYQQFHQEMQGWSAVARDVADMALSDMPGTTGQVAELRNADGLLKAVGRFSPVGEDTIHIEAVAAQSPGGGIAWLKRLAERFPDKEFVFTPGDEKLEKYYMKMGAEDALSKPDPGNVRLYRGEGAPFSGENLPEWMQSSRGRWYTDDPKVAARYGTVHSIDIPEQIAAQIGTGKRGEYLLPEEMAQSVKEELVSQGGTKVLSLPQEKVAKLAQGEDLRAKPAIDAPENIRGIIHAIDERVLQEVEQAHKLGFPRRETQEMWQEIRAMTSDPVEAIGMFVFKNQVRVRAREFGQRMFDNPLFARPIERSAPLPAGFRPITNPVDKQRYAVLNDMAAALEDLVNPQFLDKSTSKVMRALSMPQNYWKQFATSANPSFHVMNFLGAIWNNLYAGIYNPGDYLDAITTLYRGRFEEAYQAGANRYMGRLTKSTEKGRAARDVLNEARVRGATADTASIYAEVSEGLTKGPINITGELPPSVKARVVDIVKRRPAESRGRYALRQSRRGAAIGMLATGNPVGVALLAPEAAHIGRTVGTTIEDIVRLAPFMKASKDPVLMRYLEAFGPIRISNNAHPGFSKEMQAAMYDIGAAVSKHFQFDYSDLTDFERRFAKTIFPFYTFYKKNTALQVALVAQAPRGIEASQAVMNFLNDNGDLTPEMQDMLPGYFDQISAFQVPVPQGMRKKLGLPLDQPLYLNPKLPFVSLNLIPPVWNVFMNSGQPTSSKLLSVVAPMLGSVGPFAPLPIPGMKILLEASVGESLGLNKSLDYQRSQSNDYRNSWVPAPAWVEHLPGPVRDFMGIFPFGATRRDKQGNMIMTATGQYILNQMATPFVTNLGQVIPSGGQDEGKTKADTVSWLTGIRLIPVDMLRIHRSWAYQMESMLEGRRADLKDQGKELDPVDLQSLYMVRAMIDQLETAWDRKQAELYPEGGK